MCAVTKLIDLFPERSIDYSKTISDNYYTANEVNTVSNVPVDEFATNKTDYNHHHVVLPTQKSWS